MNLNESSFVATAGVRRALVQEGDIRAEIEFQNDINGILARIDDGSQILDVAPWTPPKPTPALSRRAASGRGGNRRASDPSHEGVRDFAPGADARGV